MRDRNVFIKMCVCVCVCRERERDLIKCLAVINTGNQGNSKKINRLTN
jgi:hypothetical protein